MAEEKPDFAANQERGVNYQVTVDQVCDFIISRASEGGRPLNHLKLQKLLYYADVWYMAFFKKPLFEEKFQAWVHGPVSRKIYNRLISTKSLYSTVDMSDISPDFDENAIPKDIREHINAVLEVYDPFSGSELEEMTHNEEPWIQARTGLKSHERSENFIDKKMAGEFYSKRIKK